MHLDLSSNRIGEAGAQALSSLIATVDCLISLELSNNPLGAGGSGAVINAFVQKSTFEATTKDTEVQAPPYNRSVTSLSLRNVGFAESASVGLEDALKCGFPLRKLVLDGNGDLSSNDVKFIWRTLRIYGKDLTDLSFSHNPITITQFEILLRTLGENTVPVRRLWLACCGITKAHMALCDNNLAKNRSLELLDIAGLRLCLRPSPSLLFALTCATLHSIVLGMRRGSVVLGSICYLLL
jgi:hypothetical protein